MLIKDAGLLASIRLFSLSKEIRKRLQKYNPRLEQEKRILPLSKQIKLLIQKNKELTLGINKQLLCDQFNVLSGQLWKFFRKTYKLGKCVRVGIRHNCHLMDERLVCYGYYGEEDVKKLLYIQYFNTDNISEWENLIKDFKVLLERNIIDYTLLETPNKSREVIEKIRTKISDPRIVFSFGIPIAVGVWNKFIYKENG